MSKKIQFTNQRHAVVIGGSIAGLCAAAVLARHFDQVTILERDELPEGIKHRSATPQSHQVHVLLAKGVETYEEIFPGIHLEMRQAGAAFFDWSRDTNALHRGKWLPRFHSQISGLNCSRVLLEGVVRNRVRDLKKVKVITSARVKSFLTNDDRSIVIGVTGHWHGKDRVIEGALVVDTTGRHTKVIDRLTEIGYPRPTKVVVNSDMGYASRRVNPIDTHDWKVMIAFSNPPHNPRSAMILEEEDGNWIVTLAGQAGDYPPLDEDEFETFAETVHPAFRDAIRRSKPQTKIRGYRGLFNRLHRFDKMDRWPTGLIVMGDALCAFNPVYGQGMTAAALCARVLDRRLQRNIQPSNPWTRRLQAALVDEIRPAWLLATSEDLRWPTTLSEGEGIDWKMKLAHRYFDLILEHGFGQKTVIGASLAVQQLVRHPGSLFLPHIMMRVLLPQWFKER